VTLSIANHAASLPIAYRLYLPEDWSKDEGRRRKAHVPPEVAFKTKPEIALDQIRAAHAAGIAPGIVLADAGYGWDGAFRAGVSALGLPYSVGVQSTLSIWPPGQDPLPPKDWSGRGRKPTRLRRDAEHRRVLAKKLALGLPESVWHDVTWREGSNAPLTSRFAAVRARPAACNDQKTTPNPIEWLLIEWPQDEAEPTKYWLATLPEDTPLEVLVDYAKLRWRIERDYQELKSELGLAHYEGRGWRGFHHHATLCIAAYGFLISEKESFPPSARQRETSAVPADYRPRGAAATPGTPRRKLNRHDPQTSHRRPGKAARTMPLLPDNPPYPTQTAALVTQ
jgi:SRSO17 transposase